MKINPAVTLAAAICLAGHSLAIAAGPEPDMKGTWRGRTYTIVAGRGSHWPTNTGTFDQPGLLERDLLIEITGQEDRRFWGVATVSGSGETTREPFVGGLTGADDLDVVIADTDGYFHGHISGDAFSFCYAQAGGHAGATAVSCGEVTHTR